MEPEKILLVGKNEFDVSNISIKKTELAKKKWNILLGLKVDRDGNPLKDIKGELIQKKRRKISDKKATRGLLSIALFLIRQEPWVLIRSNTVKGTVKELFRRQFLSVWYIETLTRAEHNTIVEWVTTLMTGKKKVTRDFLNQVETNLEKMLENQTEEEKSRFMTYLLTSVGDSLTKWNTLKAALKV